MPDALPVLLTEAEVAERLRCSQSTVKRLRRQGLAYLPGRPVKIAECDLVAFLDERKRREAPPVLLEADSPEDRRARADAGARRAFEIWTLRRALR